MVYLHLSITKNFGMKINKLFGIIFVGLLLSCVVYADEDNNLKGIKEFKLLVDHNGCNKDNYSKEMLTNAKYLISNSKIKLSDNANETLYLNIFTSSGEETSTPICASHLKLKVYSYGYVENSVGQKRFSTRLSYNKSAIAWHTGSTYEDRHRDSTTQQFD